jgi:zinc transporter ZupT
MHRQAQNCTVIAAHEFFEGAHIPLLSSADQLSVIDSDG